MQALRGGEMPIVHQATRDLITRHLARKEGPNYVPTVLMQAGVGRYAARWAPPRFKDWYTACREPHEMAILLYNVGLDPRPLIRKLASRSDRVRARVGSELRWHTAEATHNAAAVLAEYIPGTLLCDALRLAFPADTVEPMLVRRVQELTSH